MKKKINGRSIRFLRYSELKSLDSKKRMEMVLEILLKNKILIIQGKLSPEEKIELIKITMSKINKKFKGIEIAVFSENENRRFFDKVKNRILKVIYGSEIDSLTIIGPATVIREIKKDPKKMDLFLN